MTLQELLEKRILTLGEAAEARAAQQDYTAMAILRAQEQALIQLREEAKEEGALLTGTFADAHRERGMLDSWGRDVQTNNAAGIGKIGIHSYPVNSDSPSQHIFMPTAEAERLIAELSAVVMWDKGRYGFDENGRCKYENREV